MLLSSIPWSVPRGRDDFTNKDAEAQRGHTASEWRSWDTSVGPCGSGGLVCRCGRACCGADGRASSRPRRPMARGGPWPSSGVIRSVLQAGKPGLRGVGSTARGEEAQAAAARGLACQLSDSSFCAVGGFPDSLRMATSTQSPLRSHTGITLTPSTLRVKVPALTHVPAAC